MIVRCNTTTVTADVDGVSPLVGFAAGLNTSRSSSCPGVEFLPSIRPTKAEGPTPVHEGCDWVSFEAVKWDLFLPQSYLVVEGQRINDVQ